MDDGRTAAGWMEVGATVARVAALLAPVARLDAAVHVGCGRGAGEAGALSARGLSRVAAS